MNNIIYIKRKSEQELINNIHQTGIVDLITTYGKTLHNNSNMMYGLDISHLNNFIKKDPFSVPQLNYENKQEIIMIKKYTKIINIINKFNIPNNTKKIINDFINEKMQININTSLRHEDEKCNMLDFHINCNFFSFHIIFYFDDNMIPVYNITNHNFTNSCHYDNKYLIINGKHEQHDDYCTFRFNEFPIIFNNFMTKYYNKNNYLNFHVDIRNYCNFKNDLLYTYIGNSMGHHYKLENKRMIKHMIIMIKIIIDVIMKELDNIKQIYENEKLTNTQLQLIESVNDVDNMLGF